MLKRPEICRFLITGSVQAGKTSYLSELVDVLIEKDLSPGGFLAPGSFKSGERSGFDLKNIKTGEHLPLASNTEHTGWIKFKNFWFNPAAFKSGQLWIEALLEADPEVVVIDEVGHLELEGSGWFAILESLKRQARTIQLWSVRESLISEVMHRWDIPDSHIIPIDIMQPNQAAELICNWSKKLNESSQKEI